MERCMIQQMTICAVSQSPAFSPSPTYLVVLMNLDVLDDVVLDGEDVPDTVCRVTHNVRTVERVA